MNSSLLLATATRAVREAGALARARLGHPGHVRYKGHREIVTHATLEVQDAIVATLLHECPGSAVLAEEGPEDAPVPVDADALWIVDPICGSLNFAAGIPHFALSVALRQRGAIRAAVVYDPCREELFAATDQGASTLNGEAITIEQISDGVEAWAAAMVGTDWPASNDGRRLASSIVGALTEQVTTCEIAGSPSLGICAVAAGRLHAYWHLDLKIWDVAAAGLILQRAGGLLTDLRGMSWLHSDGGYVASNLVVQNSMVGCLAPFIPER